MRGFVLIWDDFEKAKHFACPGDSVIFRTSEGWMSASVWMQWRFLRGEMPRDGQIPRVRLRVQSENSVSINSTNF